MSTVESRLREEYVSRRQIHADAVAALRWWYAYHLQKEKESLSLTQPKHELTVDDYMGTEKAKERIEQLKKDIVEERFDGVTVMYHERDWYRSDQWGGMTLRELLDLNFHTFISKYGKKRYQYLQYHMLHGNR